MRHGVVASDGFDGLRALLGRRRSKTPARSIGRWSAIHRDARPRGEEAGALGDGSPTEHAWLYLRRYGVVTRDLLAREPLSPPWRALVDTYRRLEARGEIRGGRFVTGLIGEQFALPEALEQLERLPRIVEGAPQVDSVAAADPLNLAGILSPGPRRSVLSSERVFLDDGVPRRPVEAAHPPSSLVITDTLSA